MNRYTHLDEDLATRLIERARLGDIDAKVRAGERLTFADGVRLYETPYLAAVGLLAHRVRTQRHGNKVFFNINQHVNYTNICQYSCKQESAQTALSFGANDIDGTVTEEKITHDAGTTEPEVLSEEQIAHLIREAGYQLVQRTTVYEEVTSSAPAP